MSERGSERASLKNLENGMPQEHRLGKCILGFVEGSDQL